jgi:hypothetical protein
LNFDRLRVIYLKEFILDFIFLISLRPSGVKWDLDAISLTTYLKSKKSCNLEPKIG